MFLWNDVGHVDTVELDREDSRRVVLQETGYRSDRVMDGFRTRQAARMLEDSAHFVEPTHSDLAGQLDAVGKVAAWAQRTPVVHESTVPAQRRRVQVLSGEDEKLLHGVVEGEHAGKAERLRPPRLIDTLQVEQPDERQSAHRPRIGYRPRHALTPRACAWTCGEHPTAVGSGKSAAI